MENVQKDQLKMFRKVNGKGSVKCNEKFQDSKWIIFRKVDGKCSAKLIKNIQENFQER